MADVSKLFLDRTTRLEAFGEEKRSALLEAAQATEDPEKYLDEQFASYYLAKNTGVPVEEVRKDYAAYAKANAYTGDPTQDYNLISQHFNQYKDTATKREYRQPKKGFQFARTAGAELAANPIRMGAGMAGMAAQVTTGLDAGTDEEVQGLFNELRAIDPAAFNNYSTGMLLKGYIPSNMRMLQGEQRAKALDLIRRGGEIGKDGVGALQKERFADNNFTQWADLLRQAADELPDDYGVDPEYRESFIGQVAAGFGQLPSFALAAATPGGILALGGAMYEEAISDYRDTVGEENFNPQEAFQTAFPYAVVGTMMERFGLETLARSVFKESGVMTFREFSKRILTAMGAEGGTESAQGFLLDALAATSYDTDRELLSADAFLKRLTEFGVGAIVSGGISTAGNTVTAIDQAATKRSVLMTMLDGPLSPQDFKVFKETWGEDKIRQRIKDPVQADFFIRGMNGDLEAQQNYNATLVVKSPDFKADFTVNGVTVGEFRGQKFLVNQDKYALALNPERESHRQLLAQLERADELQQAAERAKSEPIEADAKKVYGSYGGKVILMPDTGEAVQVEGVRVEDSPTEAGRFAVYDSEDNIVGTYASEHEARVAAVDLGLEQSQELAQSTLELMEFYENFGNEFRRENKPVNLLTKLKAGAISEKRAYEIIKGLGWDGETDPHAYMEDVVILGESLAQFKGKVWKDVAGIYNGGSAFTVIEEVAENYIKRRILADGDVTLDDIRQWKKEYEEYTGDENPRWGDSNEDLIEWFSDRAIDYATGKGLLQRDAVDVPSTFKSFLLKVRAYIQHIVTRAETLFQMKADGELDATLEWHLKNATMMDSAVVERRVREYEMEQAKREAGHTPENELLAVIRRLGGLPSPNAVNAKNDPLRAELRDLYNNWPTRGKNRRLQMFRKDGASLDGLVEKLREEGFRVETTVELLDLIDDSLNGGENYSQTDGTSIDDIENTFMTAYHGTPHTFDRFSLDHIGTGEGAQAYGWGLYFAGKREIAEYYKRSLTKKLDSIKIGDVTYEYGPTQETYINTAIAEIDAQYFLNSNLSHREIVEKALAKIRNQEQYMGHTRASDWLSENIEQIEIIPEGKLYQVDLKPSEDEYLLWDKPLSEQSEKVREALTEAYGWNADVNPDDRAEMRVARIVRAEPHRTGEHLYEAIVDEMYQGWLGDPSVNKKQKASEALRSLGIRGIKYLDGNSRSTRSIKVQKLETPRIYKGKWATVFTNSGNIDRVFNTKEEADKHLEDSYNRDYNYVIFDDADVEIEETFQMVRKPLTEVTGKPAEELYQSDQSPLEPLDEAFLRVRKETLQDILSRSKDIKRESTEENIDFSLTAAQGSTTTWLGSFIAPVASRLRRINPRLASAFRKVHQDIALAQQNDRRRVMDYLKALKRIKGKELTRLHIALFNQDAKTVAELNEKYGLTELYAPVRTVLNNIYARAMNAGLDLGFRSSYWPRHIDDLEGLVKYLAGADSEVGGQVQQALAAAAAKKGAALSEAERTKIVNNLLRGYKPRGLKTPGQVKDREIEQVTEDLLQFYADPVRSIMMYLDAMNEAIELRRFFGKHAVMKDGPQLQLDGEQESLKELNLEDSIGNMVLDLVESGKITPAQQEEVIAIFNGRFGFQATPPGLQKLRSIGYLTTMGQISSAITQFGDFAFAMYEGGVFNTLATAAKVVANRDRITREDIGVEMLAQELSEVSRVNKALDWVFTISGLKYIDRIGKETLVNSAITGLQRRARRGGLSQRDQKRLNDIFGEDAVDVMGDLSAGEVTDNVLLLAYNILLDYQPVALSEMPLEYLNNPRGRVFYMLKTFTIKQLDAFRREGIDEIVNGNVRRGMMQLLKIMLMFYVANVPIDWIKDWIYGRQTDLDDVAVDNIWKLMGLTRYNLYYSRQVIERGGNPLMIPAHIVMPPIPYLELPLNDAFDAYDKLSEGDSLDIGDFESWRMVPWVGKGWYWHFGAGKEKTENRKKKERKDRY